ncbi:LytR/AlgR family response regulator transcription factor [Moorella sp. ACPs]|uniref:LytR/AlgR family response regulator transcription factor n=1 Tax=Neomoorella carbonis TaxID=3062783 RepID=UPI00324B38A4
MTFTAIVVDDEPLARDELKYLLSAYEECRVVGEAENGEEALQLVAKLHPDVVFLDIEMQGLSGYDAARKMLADHKPPLIVFATAYNEYAVEAFELGAIDYLLKPFVNERLAKTIERIKKIRARQEDWQEAVARVARLLGNNQQPVKKLPVEKNGTIKLLDYADIFYGRARGGGVQIFTADDSYTFNGTMAELEERLKRDGFFRVHKSFLVNLKRVEGVLPWFKGTYWLVMGDRKRTQIPVSKGQVKELKVLLGLN